MLQCFEDSVWASFQAEDILNSALKNIYGIQDAIVVMNNKQLHIMSIQDAIMVLNNKQLHIMKHLDEACLGMREQTMGKE